AGTRAYTTVCSREVAAFSSPPSPSKISAISCAVYDRLPLKSRCSMKCVTPAFGSGSSREPVPIQNPSATERTVETRSVIRRSPESSSERTYSCTTSIVLAPKNPTGGGVLKNMEAFSFAESLGPPRRAAAAGDSAVPASSDWEPFELLVRRHHAELRTFAYRFLGDRWDVDDVLQEAYVKAFRAYRRFDARRGLARPWLYRIVHRACLDELRRQRRRPWQRLETAGPPHEPE